jgi:hypothetical protein
MIRTIAIGLVGLGLMVSAAHAARVAGGREATLDDVAPAAVAAVEEASAPPLVRESLRRQPRLGIPMPGFGDFGTTPPPEAPADDGSFGLFRMHEVRDGEGQLPEVQP